MPGLHFACSLYGQVTAIERQRRQDKAALHAGHGKVYDSNTTSRMEHGDRQSGTSQCVGTSCKRLHTSLFQDAVATKLEATEAQNDHAPELA